ncbi:hypothetical protein [Streptomyces sp. NPDC057854]|uniref:hypothetical protein n=1 Tax=unclassified Streptomyces TaxID=2593676 RepID=UPI0036794A16
MLSAEVARIAGVGRAAVVHWRRRHADFLDPAGGTTVHPTFARSAVVAWLLAHDKIAVPSTVPNATLHLRPAGQAPHRFRLADPWLTLSGDPEGEDRLTGWTSDVDADSLAVLAAADASVSRLTASGVPPLAIPGHVRAIDRFSPRSGRTARHPRVAEPPARPRRPHPRRRTHPPRPPVHRPRRHLRMRTADLRRHHPRPLLPRLRPRRRNRHGMAPSRRHRLRARLTRPATALA